MMIDKGIFSTRQAITLSGTTTGTNVVDTEVANSNQGAGTPIWLVVQVSTSLVGATGTANTMAASLQDCATSGGTYTTIVTGYAFSVAEVLKGINLLSIPLPAKHKRYLGVIYTTGTGSGWLSGNVNAFLSTVAPRTS